MDKNKSKDKTYKSRNSFANPDMAFELFQKSREKLFDINRWSKLPGITSSFQLFGSNGDKKNSTRPEINNYIKIILPGPFPENWVVVRDITDQESMANFVVSPSENPEKKWREGIEIAHFFIKEATSTFQVEIRDSDIFAYEIGKNEAINNEGYEAGKRKVINTLLAEGGWAGFQKYQWKKLLDYLVHKIEID